MTQRVATGSSHVQPRRPIWSAVAALGISIAVACPLAGQQQSEAQVEGRRLLERAMQLAERGDTVAAVEQAGSHAEIRV